MVQIFGAIVPGSKEPSGYKLQSSVVCGIVADRDQLSNETLTPEKETRGEQNPFKEVGESIAVANYQNWEREEVMAGLVTIKDRAEEMTLTLRQGPAPELLDKPSPRGSEEGAVKFHKSTNEWNS